MVKKILQELHISSFKVESFSCFNDNYRFYDDATLHFEDDILCLVKDCLRKRCWCKLSADNFFIHFGYDYYMYIGCNISENRMNEIASQNCLYSELIKQSPYLITDCDDDLNK